jgi:hypothetical protein
MTNDVKQSQENKIIEEFSEISNKAQSSLGPLWNILDSIEPYKQNSPSNNPYGEKKPKPYGWYNKPSWFNC